MINYKTLTTEPLYKAASICVEVDLQIEGKKPRLPTKDELSEVSHLLKKQADEDKVYVLFYLPDMGIERGAFATAHHLPEFEGVVMLWDTLYMSGYSEFVPE